MRTRRWGMERQELCPCGEPESLLTDVIDRVILDVPAKHTCALYSRSRTDTVSFNSKTQDILPPRPRNQSPHTTSYHFTKWLIPVPARTTAGEFGWNTKPRVCVTYRHARSACGPSGTGCACPKGKCNCQDCTNNAASQKSTVRTSISLHPIRSPTTHIAFCSVAVTTAMARSAPVRRQETSAPARSEQISVVSQSEG